MDRIEEIVRDIKNRVKKQGIKAVLYYTKRFDGVYLKKIVYRKEDLKKAYTDMDKKLRNIYKRIYNKIYRYHSELKKTYIKDFSFSRNGVKIKFSFIPLNSVGVYVPGGKYPYPSTVFMTVIPAKISGVKNIFVSTPPKNLSKEILAACYITGVDELYSIGGAQAIFSFAYGIKPVKKVDKIVGPGNVYVNEAKRQIFGEVGIDTLAGPSEVAVLLIKERFNYEFLKSDLLAQLEHGRGTSSYFITTSKNAYSKIKKDIKKVKSFYFKDVYNAIRKVNEIAPEHLLFIGEKRFLKHIKNAGAIFIGENSSVSFGDYVAGPSHVLPTGKSSVFSSGLSIFDFYKTRAEIFYSKKALEEDFEDAIIFSRIEGMKMHTRAVELRVRKFKGDKREKKINNNVENQ